MADPLAPLLDRVDDLAIELPRGGVDALASVLMTSEVFDWAALRARVAVVVAGGRARALALELLNEWHRAAPEVDARGVALALRAAARAKDVERHAQHVELVWTGPDMDAVPLRRTDQALLQIVERARVELTIVSFAVYRIPRVWDAIAGAAGRGVRVQIVLESAEASEGRLAYDGLHAFGSEIADRARFFIWPRDQRPMDDLGRRGTLHVKCAVADATEMLISSANLTERALTINMEMGLLVRGGAAPARAARHFSRLIEGDVLTEWLPRERE